MKKWYAVIGDPILQSMSPVMHEHWFNENKVNASYIPIHVTANRLGEAVKSLKELGCSGWNVTVPHKSAILPFLDRLNPSAQLMNAVNTVQVLSDGTLLGSNTDGEGFVRSLEEVFGNRCKNDKILIIGSGGAAQGIAFALQASGYGPLVLSNRTIANADHLAKRLENASTLSLEDAEYNLAEFGLIIQTTSVGMNFLQKGMPLNPEKVVKNTIIADIIYNPLETEFLFKSRNSGAQTMNGVGMFVHQGALAFEKWTTIQPDTQKMINKITETLGGTYVNR